ncbi:MAG: sulfatase-like hydrolase/transferase, partial [Bacteroidia bacterium]|nr:sulfatase-like hydrolase/transferase [Bacteroidia bacterium]
MIQVLRYFIKVLLVFLAVFLTAKLFFLLVNLQEGFADIKQFPTMWWNGLRLDLSLIGYILIIPLLLLLIRFFVKNVKDAIFRYYFAIIFILIAIIVATDPFFYSYWGQKANLSFIQFLGKENAGVASIAIRDFILAFGFLFLLIFCYFKWFSKWLIPPQKKSLLGLIVLLGLSVLMVRGGLGIVPINISSAFYSSNNFHNNTALNTVWNAMATEFERDKHKALVFYDSNDEAEEVLSKLPKSNNGIDHLVAKDSSTNVLLIVLESFSAKVSGLLSGEEFASTPNLDSIMKEGIYFNNAYASSFRSDKGLLALTSGIPSGARQTLTNFPDRLAA